MYSLAEFVDHALRGLTKLVATAMLGVLVMSLLLFGVAAALLSVVWSLLRGKRPAMFTVFQSFQQMSRQFRRGPGGATTAAPGDVVDVQAHEVRQGHQALNRPEDADLRL